MSESPKTYGPEQENAFFQGTVSAADEKSAEWGVSTSVILGDFVSNALACLLVDGTADEVGSLLVAAETKAAAVMRTRELREDVLGE